jgi:hypothetical protein
MAITKENISSSTGAKKKSVKTKPVSKKTARPASAKKTSGAVACMNLPAEGSQVGDTRQHSLGLDIDADVLEFITAIEQFRQEHNKMFPSYSEILHVLRSLGYQK